MPSKSLVPLVFLAASPYSHKMRIFKPHAFKKGGKPSQYVVDLSLAGSFACEYSFSVAHVLTKTAAANA